MHTATHQPEFTPPADLSREWDEIVSTTASDQRETITRIRRAKALLAIIEQWGDTAFDDITAELSNRVIEPAEEALREALRSTAFTASDDACEHEIEDRVHETPTVEILRAWTYRRPLPLNFLVAADFARVWHAEVLTGLPLSAEVEERVA
jgi:hypothetical protein